MNSISRHQNQEEIQLILKSRVFSNCILVFQCRVVAAQNKIACQNSSTQSKFCKKCCYCGGCFPIYNQLLGRINIRNCSICTIFSVQDHGYKPLSIGVVCFSKVFQSLFFIQIMSCKRDEDALWLSCSFVMGSLEIQRQSA